MAADAENSPDKQDLPEQDLKIAVLPVTPLQQNCTLVWSQSTGRGAVIDPGGEPERIIAAIESQNIDLVKILLTHAHVDHAGAVQDIKEHFSVPIEGPHRADQFWIDRIESDGVMFGVGHCRTFVPDRWLDHGDKVEVGPFEFSVFHCPGHTPGHVIFYNEPAGFAQVGDVLFKGSIGRTDFPHSSHDDLIRSVIDHLWSLGRDVWFVPGHGPMSTFGEERDSNPFVGDAVTGFRSE